MKILTLSLLMTFCSVFVYASHNNAASTALLEEIKPLEKIEYKVVKNYLFIDMDLDIFGETIHIVNAKGKKMASHTIYTKYLDLDLSNYPKGEYSFIMEGVEAQRSFVIE